MFNNFTNVESEAHQFFHDLFLVMLEKASRNDNCGLLQQGEYRNI